MEASGFAAWDRAPVFNVRGREGNPQGPTALHGRNPSVRSVTLDGMGALHRSPRIRFSGTRKGRGLIAVLALEGSSPDRLRDACTWARSNGSKTLRVAVDGGLRAWRSLSEPCDLFVGDGDSARPPRDKETILYNRDKAFSDLAGALGEMRRREARVVCLAGLTGGRLDHEWINLHELAAHARDFAGLLAPTSRGWVAVTSHGAGIETRPGKTFSLLALAGRARVDLQGSRWTLDNASIRPGSRGLSNVSGKRLRLTVTAGVACLIFPKV